MKPLLNYFSSSRTEIMKVTWPNRQQLVRLTIIVIIFSLVFAVFLGAIDFAFGEGLQYILNA